MGAILHSTHAGRGLGGQVHGKDERASHEFNRRALVHVGQEAVNSNTSSTCSLANSTHSSDGMGVRRTCHGFLLRLKRFGRKLIRA